MTLSQKGCFKIGIYNIQWFCGGIKCPPSTQGQVYKMNWLVTYFGFQIAPPRTDKRLGGSLHVAFSFIIIPLSEVPGLSIPITLEIY